MRLFLSLAVALTVLGGNAEARTVSGIITPPARYASGPLPPLTHEVTVPAADVDRLCRSLGAGADRTVRACHSDKLHLIVLPSDDPWLYPLLKAHEEAHARGWPADHPE